MVERFEGGTGKERRSRKEAHFLLPPPLLDQDAPPDGCGSCLRFNCNCSASFFFVMRSGLP